jgi:hypothetical protein
MKQELKNSWEVTIAAKKAIKEAPPAPFNPGMFNVFF